MGCLGATGPCAGLLSLQLLVVAALLWQRVVSDGARATVRAVGACWWLAANGQYCGFVPTVAMGLADLMTSEATSPSGRPLRPEAKGKADLSSSARNLSRSSAGDNDAYIAQIIVKDQDRQQKQAASEMRRLGVELREVSLPPASRLRPNARRADATFCLAVG